VKKRNVVSKKDKEAWKAFTDNIEDIQPKKDDLSEQSLDVNKIKKLDLHGFSLNDANEKVKEFINESFIQGYRKLLIVTGKGSRSKVHENPYVSDKFSVLKYSVPEFINAEKNLSKKIIKISLADKKHGGDGAIYIFLKKNFKE
tara:strand:+ start:3991 stop:4422 length:432 start_codon:yes stop_codon:yes gene_type:complete